MTELHLTIAAAALMTALSACSTPLAPPAHSATAPATTDTSGPAEGPPAATTAAVPAPAESTTAKPACRAAQFVACHDGKACERRQSKFVTPKTCYDRAAAACQAAACQHGCDIYETEIGGPKMVLCAPNAASTGNMKSCGGIANWQCPEKMTCRLAPEDEHTLDATGTCVPVS